MMKGVHFFMKILVLYNTVDGNTQAVAEAIANALDADLVKIVRVKGVRAYGFFTKLRKAQSFYRRS